MVRLGTYQFRYGLSHASPVCKNSGNAESAAKARGRETVGAACRVATGAWARSPKPSRVRPIWPVGRIGIRGCNQQIKLDTLYLRDPYGCNYETKMNRGCS